MYFLSKLLHALIVAVSNHSITPIHGINIAGWNGFDDVINEEVSPCGVHRLQKKTGFAD